MAPDRLHRGRLARTLLALALTMPAAAAGQVLTTIEFSFSNPGARSLGFGGAFVALADDATAAFANPAGLVQLSRPEVSLEGRFWSYSSPYTAGGRATGTPLGAWHDPDHQPRNDSTPFSRAEIPGGTDELHLAAGFGLALEELQIDLGIDTSELRDTASVSVIYSF